MTFSEQIAQIESNKDLAKFIQKLIQDYATNPDDWENGDLLSYLEAMAAWVSDADGYYRNSGQPMPAPAAWKTVATVLYAAKKYE